MSREGNPVQYGMEPAAVTATRGETSTKGFPESQGGYPGIPFPVFLKASPVRGQRVLQHHEHDKASSITKERRLPRKHRRGILPTAGEERNNRKEVSPGGKEVSPHYQDVQKP